MQHSLSFYPSLRESFGIPLVEAMACGTPVITGNTSSMPEVGGPDILAADPCRPEEIAGAVLRLENGRRALSAATGIWAAARPAILVEKDSR